MEKLSEKQLAAYEINDFKLDYEAELREFAIQYWREHARHFGGMTEEQVSTNLWVDEWLNKLILRSVSPTLANRLMSVDSDPVESSEIRSVISRTRAALLTCVAMVGAGVGSLLVMFRPFVDYMRTIPDWSFEGFVTHVLPMIISIVMVPVAGVSFLNFFDMQKFLRLNAISEVSPADLESDPNVLLEFNRQLEEEFFTSRRAKIAEIIAYYEDILRGIGESCGHLSEEEFDSMESRFNEKLEMWRGVARDIEDIMEWVRADCLRLQFLAEGAEMPPEIQGIDAQGSSKDTKVAVAAATILAELSKS